MICIGFKNTLMRNKCTKKGTYILEAAISLPVFLIAVTVMSSIILMYSCIEDCNFIAAQELRRGGAESVYADTSVLIPYRIKKRAVDEHSRVESAAIRDYGYRTSRWGLDELIIIKMRLDMNSPNPIGIRSRADYDIAAVTRAYVGRIRSVSPMSDDEMSGNGSEAVYIFPARGERYHDRGCGFLTASFKAASLTAGIRKNYRPCPLCRSGRAPDGTTIYYFPSAGDDYHLPECQALKRNYIEIDKQDAVSRGYTPCAKCGG